jgi:hypothetical protein
MPRSAALREPGRRDAAGRLVPPAVRPAGARLAIGTWVDGEFVLLEAELVGLSGDGALALVRGAIAVDQSVWLRLVDSAGSGGAPATVLARTWLRGGRCAVRLALEEDCPAGFVETLVARLAETSAHRHWMGRGPRARA